MMAPTLALDADGVVLAAGAAGGTRLRSALLAGRRGDPRRGSRAAGRGRPPRFTRRRARPPGAGFGRRVRARVCGLRGSRGSRHHFFGGVSASRRRRRGDPRRSGAARTCGPSRAPSRRTRIPGSRGSRGVPPPTVSRSGAAGGTNGLDRDADPLLAHAEIDSACGNLRSLSGLAARALDVACDLVDQRLPRSRTPARHGAAPRARRPAAGRRGRPRSRAGTPRRGARCRRSAGSSRSRRLRGVSPAAPA